MTLAKQLLRARGIWSGVKHSNDPAGRYGMLHLINKHVEGGVFQPEEVRILVAAFDAAWESVQSSGAQLSDDQIEEARNLIAKIIIEAASRASVMNTVSLSVLSLSMLNSKIRCRSSNPGRLKELGRSQSDPVAHVQARLRQTAQLCDDIPCRRHSG
jgi:hypothetical protein